MLSRIVRLLAATAMVLAVAGCDGDEPPEPMPTVTSSPTESPTTSPTVPAYLEGYSEEERAAYEAAAKDYRQFSRRQADIYAEGRATADAREFYKARTASWRSYWARLQQFERDGYRVVGTGTTLSVRPANIQLSDGGGGRVVLRVCGVARGVELWQNGTPVPQPKPKRTVVRARMVNLPGEDVWRVLYEKVDGRC